MSIKLEHVVLASPEQMEFIIEGMRNPMNSWEKSDSYQKEFLIKVYEATRDGQSVMYIPGRCYRRSSFKLLEASVIIFDAQIIKDQDEEICLLRNDFMVGSLSEEILNMTVTGIENDENIENTVVVYVTDEED